MNQHNTIYIFVLLIIFILFENNRYISESFDQTNALNIFSAGDHRIVRRQSARWSLAAKQDMNPVIGLLHANYGTAYQMFLLMNGIREETMIEKTFMIERNIVTDVNNKCNQSIKKIKFDTIDDIVQLIGIARQKNNSINPIECAFQLIELIDRYSSEHSDNQLIELICANYCCGVYWAITDLRTHSQISDSLRSYISDLNRNSKNILQIRDMLIDKQDKMTIEYSKICIHYNISEIGDDYLAKVAGDK